MNSIGASYNWNLLLKCEGEAVKLIYIKPSYTRGEQKDIYRGKKATELASLHSQTSKRLLVIESK